MVKSGGRGAIANILLESKRDFIGCPFDYVQSVTGFPMLVGKWNFVNESGIRGVSEISGKIVYGANGDFNHLRGGLYLA